MNKLNRLQGAIGWILTEHINKKSAEETYDLVSKNSNYDEIVGFDERRDALKELIRNENITNKDVLDIACGSGAFIDAVLNKKPRSIVGVDLSTGMLKLAKRRFNGNRNITLIHNSFMDVVFNPKSFDFILLANAARYIPKEREDEFFKNIRRWLKVNGCFIILSDNIFGTNQLGKILVSFFYSWGNDKNINKKTSLEWNMETELKKHFVIEKTKGVGWAWHGKAKHTAYFCKIKS